MKICQIWQRCHLQIIFGKWNSTYLSGNIRPNGIKGGNWNLTNYDGNMFQFNAVYGCSLPRIIRLIWAISGVLVSDHYLELMPEHRRVTLHNE